MNDNKESVRLNKHLATQLGVSRREADQLIAGGKVTIDGKPAILGVRIDKTNKVCYNNKMVPFESNFLYLAFHKPVGYVCSRRAQGDTPTLYSLLPTKYHNLKTVGRLDKNSSGLILLTNDGDFAYQMTHPKFRKTKIYEVELDHPLEPLHQQMISDYGVMLDDGPSRFKVLTNDHSHRRATVVEGVPHESSSGGGQRPAGPVERMSFTVILTEGRNRQIRRTFAALGYHVTKLHRTTFGKYELGDLKPGKYVDLNSIVV